MLRRGSSSTFGPTQLQVELGVWRNAAVNAQRIDGADVEERSGLTKTPLSSLLPQSPSHSVVFAPTRVLRSGPLYFFWVWGKLVEEPYPRYIILGMRQMPARGLNRSVCAWNAFQGPQRGGVYGGACARPRSVMAPAANWYAALGGASVLAPAANWYAALGGASACAFSS